MSVHLSIVIPTRKRPDILATCLQHIEKQHIAQQLEVIVIHDGHDDNDTAHIAQSNWHIPVYYTSIPKSQQGIARNYGVQKAQASTVLFIGDDIFLQPDACEVHLTQHRKTAHHAVLGFTDWDPSLHHTPVMQFLTRSGWQFGYTYLQQYAHASLPKKIQHKFTYTSHISLPKKIAMQIPFREDVSLYGWEDIEWGMRLRDAGVPLYYEPDAIAWHHHPMNLEQSLKRMEHIGRSAVTFAQISSQFDRLPMGMKRVAYSFAALLPTMMGKHRKAFLRGIHQAEKACKHTTTQGFSEENNS